MSLFILTNQNINKPKTMDNNNHLSPQQREWNAQLDRWLRQAEERFNNMAGEVPPSPKSSKADERHQYTTNPEKNTEHKNQ
jgi:hypothetical protein